MNSLVILFYFIIHILTWNFFAHSVIARIAEIKLSETEPNLAILDRIYSTLASLATFFPETPNSLSEAAVMPDFLNFKFRGFLSRYHYIDYPDLYKNDDSIPLPPINDINAEFAIKSAIQVIKDSFSNDVEHTQFVKRGLVDSLLTRYLIHVVGDSHQPLHAHSLFSAILFNGAIIKGDRGGNLIKINDPFDSNTKNLHSFWDNGLGLFPNVIDFPYDQKMHATIDVVANQLMNELPIDSFGAAVNELNPKVWLNEGHEIATRIAYADIDLFPSITPQYVINGREICKHRVTLAGYRLANVLRDAFKLQ